MRPIKNTLSLPFNVGDELAYLGREEEHPYENGGIVVTEIKICSRSPLCGGCTGYKFYDTDGNEWCGIPDDFEVS